MENSLQSGITQTFNQSLMQSSVSGGAGTQGGKTAVGSLAEKPKITINLMDVSFLEQNLQQILEVSSFLVLKVYLQCL